MFLNRLGSAIRTTISTSHSQRYAMATLDPVHSALLAQGSHCAAPEVSQEYLSTRSRTLFFDQD